MKTENDATGCEMDGKRDENDSAVNGSKSWCVFFFICSSITTKGCKEAETPRFDGRHGNGWRMFLIDVSCKCFDVACLLG